MVMATQPRDHRTLFHVLPFLSWFQGYGGRDLRQDAVAGITVAIILIPQAMAYAMLAGLPPVYGLYAAALTPAIGGLWGSLRQLSTGPIAIMSLLVLTTLSPRVAPGTAGYLELAFTLSLLIAMIYLLIGAFRLGIVMTFISHAAVKGFTSAAALIIIVTQLPNLLGVQAGHHEFVYRMILDLLRQLPALHPPTLLLGLAAFVFIYTIKRKSPRFPAALTAIVITGTIIQVFNLEERGIAVIGQVPVGLPAFHLPSVAADTVFELIGPAMVIALVSFAETFSISKAITAHTKQIVRTDQEFIGQGLANLVGGLFQCLPVSGSMSRTAINFEAGARTGIAGLITSLVVILTLLFLTPLLAYIPKAVLSALVIGAVLLLFHPGEVFRLWRQNPDDGAVGIAVFILALLIKPDYALLIGVVVSLVFFLWKTMHPRIVRMTRDERHKMFVNADANMQPSCPQILHLRVDNAIYFGNAEYTVEHILERVDAQTTPVKFLLLCLEVVGFMDLTGVDELQVLKEELTRRNIKLALMRVHRPVHQLLSRSGFLDSVVFDNLSDYKGEAISKLFSLIDHGYCRNDCPYRLFDECDTVKQALG